MSSFLFVLILGLFSHQVHSNFIPLIKGTELSNEHVDSDSDRSSRPFPLFTIVRITNQACTPEDVNAGQGGICYTRNQCQSAKGIVSGSCASGFGVCCIVSATCEGVVTTNNTVFRNREHPEANTPSALELCNLRITKPKSNVCQVRLDFDQMELADPDGEGVCQIDRLSINGVSNKVPGNLCGSLTGQHMYLDYGSSDRITISVITDGAASKEARNWNVRITYIECNSILRAPSGCLQYFTAATGTVRMFNYPFAPHLAELDYTVCVRPEDGAGSIVWAPCPGEPPLTAFLMTGAARTDPVMGGMFGDMDCLTDYVLIMSDEDPVPPAPPAGPTWSKDDRYCENSFAMAAAPFALRTSAKPFIMRVVTDENEADADVMNTGFCLMWRQEPPSKLDTFWKYGPSEELSQ